MALQTAWISGRDLLESTPAEPEWIVPYIVAEGVITELIGMIKLSGKTTFAVALARCVALGEPFASEPVQKMPVVYLTEQNESVFHSSLNFVKMPEEGYDNLSILCWYRARGYLWPEIMASAIEKAQQVGSKLIIVDTLSQFAFLGPEEEKDRGAALRAMQPLQYAAGLGIGVLSVRHERKEGGNLAVIGAGSTGFSQVADWMIGLKRVPGNRPSVRELEFLGRFGSLDNKQIEWCGDRYVLLEDSDLPIEQAKRAILSRLPILAHDLLLEGFAETTVRRALRLLISDGIIIRQGRGVKSDPHVYKLGLPR